MENGNQITKNNIRNNMKRYLSILFFAMVSICSTTAQTSLQQSILFSSDSIYIQESQEGTLQLIVEYINKHPNETIIIGGFTSLNTPKDKVNDICTQRAELVKEKLIKVYNIDPKHLIAIGVGISTKYEETTYNEVVSFFKK